MIKISKSSFLFLQLPIFLLLIFLVVSIFLLYNNAHAHPVVIDSNPKQFQTIESPPNRVTVYFSEPIVLQYSQISVVDSNGNEIKGGKPDHTNDDDTTISMPLEGDINEGSFTVTTRVLSAVDGHVVDNSVLFNVGKKGAASTTPDFANIQTKGKKEIFDILSIENSAARIAGYIGQIILVGAPFVYLWVQRPFLNLEWLKNMLQSNFDSIQKNLIKLLIFSDFLVILSIFAIVTVQASAIGGTITDVFNTEFGKIIVARLLLSLVLLTILFFTYRTINSRHHHNHYQNLDLNNKITFSIIIGIGFGILFTNSLISHAAALDNFAPIFIDYFHGIAASFWIGGLIFLAFVFIKKIRKIQNVEIKSRIVSITIDRFSVIVLPILGSIAITGPTLLWSLENNLSITFASLYGKILILKLVLAGIMIIIGAYHQLVTSKKMRQQIMIVNKLESKGRIVSNEINNNNNNNNIDQQINKFATSLRVEAIIGISLLFVVSLMTNMVLPSGEIPSFSTTTATSDAIIADNTVIKNNNNGIKANNAAFSTILYNDNNKIKISLDPVSLGENKIFVNFIDYNNNNPIESIGSAGIKLSQLENNIGPIPIEMDKIGEGTFSANIPLSTLGIWNIEIQGKTTEPNTPNIISNFEVNVKPQLENLEFNVTEFKTPDKSLLLYPVYHAKTDSIWVGDTFPGSGRLWQFNINNNTFTEHTISGTNLITFSAFDTTDDNILWFIDPTSSTLGKYNIQTDENEMIQTPISGGIVSGIVTDNRQNLWMTVMQDNSLLKYDIDKNDFETFRIPTENSRPVGLIYDEGTNAIWFTESGVGKIGRLDIQAGNITEFPTNQTSDNDNNKEESLMQELTTLLLDKQTSNIYISDHLGNSIFSFNPLLSSFKKYPLSDNNDGLAFGMVFDKYNNILIAQHVSDTIAVLDPATGNTINFNIPTNGSFVQYLVTDSNNNIWLAEQRGEALAKVSTKFIPSSSPSSSLSSSTTQELPAVATNQQKIDSVKSNQTMMTSINDIIKNIDLKFSDIFGPIIVIALVVSAILLINSSNRLDANIKDIEKLEPRREIKKRKKN